LSPLRPASDVDEEEEEEEEVVVVVVEEAEAEAEEPSTVGTGAATRATGVKDAADSAMPSIAMVPPVATPAAAPAPAIAAHTPSTGNVAPEAAPNTFTDTAPVIHPEVAIDTATDEAPTAPVLVTAAPVCELASASAAPPRALLLLTSASAGATHGFKKRSRVRVNQLLSLSKGRFVAIDSLRISSTVGKGQDKWSYSQSLRIFLLVELERSFPCFGRPDFCRGCFPFFTFVFPAPRFLNTD
jgi:hypothetical protein